MCVCCDVTCVREWLSVCVCVCQSCCVLILLPRFFGTISPVRSILLTSQWLLSPILLLPLVYLFLFCFWRARIFRLHKNKRKKIVRVFFVCVCLGFVIIIVVVLLFSCFTNTLPKTKEKENEEEEEKNIKRDTTTAHVNRKCSFSMGNHFVCHCHTTDPNEIDNKKF